MVDYIKQIEDEQSKKENSEFVPGDTVEVQITLNKLKTNNLKKRIANLYLEIQWKYIKKLLKAPEPRKHL